MAINNWRYVVTWGFREPDGTIVEERQRVPGATTDWRYVVTWEFREPDGTIVEERQWVPWVSTSTSSNTIASTTSSPKTTHFPNIETYGFQAQGYANQWDNAMASAYGSLVNNLWKYSKFANNTLTWYDALLNYISQNETGLQNVAWKTYNTLVSDIQNQRDYINRMFGPDGELTKEVNAYYDDLWNYLATDAGRQAANIAAQWVHSWASLWAIRAQQNAAYNESFGRYVQAKEQQINAKQQIASNLINYMSALRQEYWDTTNQYIIELYKRANDMYNAIAQSAAKDLIEYNNLRLSGWSSSSWQYYDIFWNLVDKNWKIIKTKAQLDAEKKQTVYWPTVNNPYINATVNAWKSTYWLDKATQPYIKV